MNQAQTFTIAGERLNSTIKRVYAWMSGGLLLTAVVSLLVVNNERLINALSSGGLLFILILAELGLVLYLSFRILTIPYQRAKGLFLAYAALNGITLAPIFLIYTGSSIVATFFVTAGTFGALSIWAMTTKHDLSGWGQYLFFGLIGIIIASVVNGFLGSGTLDLLISVGGVILFMALTAFDTQRIKKWSKSAEFSNDDEMVGKLAILGALKLYLDFINLFLFLLRFMGRRR